MMRRFVAVLGVLLLSGFLLPAVDVEPPVFRGGLLFLGTSEEDMEAAPSPVLSSFGISLPLRFSDHILLEPALQFHGTFYGFPGSQERPIPVPVETINKSWVFALLIDPAFRMEWEIMNTGSLGFSVSPGFFFRFPLVAYDDGTFDNVEARSYFFGSGRFFYPKAGVFYSWGVTENLTLRFQADTWFPLFHAWDGGAVPFYDELIVCFWIGLSARVPPKQTETDQLPF